MPLKLVSYMAKLHALLSTLNSSSIKTSFSHFLKKAALFTIFFLYIIIVSAPSFASEIIAVRDPNFTKAPYAFLIDYNTKTVLFDKQSDQPLAPSSMSKLMTLYVVFHNLKNGKIKLEDELTVSKKAWSMGGSKMFLAYSSKVKVEDLLRGAVVHSGNDACITLAEGLAGDESIFVQQMNNIAKEIGLTSSVFKNATGWPEEGHFMTARDLTRLASRLIDDFPEYYHYFAEPTFTFNNITQQNRNTLIGKRGVDGIKTGHTETAGYGLIFSSYMNGRRLIGVVNGLKSAVERSIEAEKLINLGLGNFDNITLFSPHDTVTSLKVKYGKKDLIDLAAKGKIEIVLPKLTSLKDLRLVAIHENPIEAPIKQGDKLGTLKIEMKGGVLGEFPLIAKEDVEKSGWFSRKIEDLKTNAAQVLRIFKAPCLVKSKYFSNSNQYGT